MVTKLQPIVILTVILNHGIINKTQIYGIKRHKNKKTESRYFAEDF